MLGLNLKKIREYLNLSQKQFAESMDSTAQAFYGYEKNIRDIPNKLLDKLVSKYNININWLLTGNGDMFITDSKAQPGLCANCEELQKLVDELALENKTLGAKIEVLQETLIKSCAKAPGPQQKKTG